MKSMHGMTVRGAVKYWAVLDKFAVQYAEGINAGETFIHTKDWMDRNVKPVDSPGDESDWDGMLLEYRRLQHVIKAAEERMSSLKADFKLALQDGESIRCRDARGNEFILDLQTSRRPTLNKSAIIEKYGEEFLDQFTTYSNVESVVVRPVAKEEPDGVQEAE